MQLKTTKALPLLEVGLLLNIVITNVLWAILTPVVPPAQPFILYSLFSKLLRRKLR